MAFRQFLVPALVLALTGCPARRPAVAPGLQAPPALDWRTFPPGERRQGRALLREIAAFLGNARTVRAATRTLAAHAAARGFTELPASGPLAPGARHLLLFKHKALALFRLGALLPTAGVSLHVLAIDAPRLDLKEVPADDRHGFLLLQAGLYGRPDLRYWLSTPLALHGFVARTPPVELSVGTQPGDPVLVIPDLLPHLAARAQAREVITGEGMDALAASVEGARARRDVLAAALAARGLDTRDFRDGEWVLVPALAPALVGVDGGLLAAYGQSHRTQAFLALRVLAEAPPPKRTQVVLFLDRGKSRYEGNTGAFFLTYAMGRLLEAAGAGSDVALRHALARSRAFVAHPNAGQLGGGVVLNRRYDDSPPALQRAVLDAFTRAKVPYQISEATGHFSLARRLTHWNVDAMDVTLPVADRGRPLELVSLFDVLAALRAYRALVAL